MPELATFIVTSIRRTAIDAWWIGKALDIARAKHKQERKWLTWLETDVLGLSKSTAYRYMALCTTFTLEKVQTTPLSALYKLMEGAKDDDTGENDAKDGAEPEEATDGAAGEELEDAGAEPADDADDQQPAIAGRIASRASAPAGKQDRDRDDAAEQQPPEPQPPVTATEIDALTVFVEAVGGLTRAQYVCEEGIKQLQELKDENG